MTTRTRSVLCVEDHLDTCYSLKALLNCLNCECQTAGTISSALELIDTHTFDLIILDQHLPDGTGLHLCKAIRFQNIQTPIIFYTGEPDGIDKPTALHAGAQHYILKPHLKQLESTIITVLGLSASSVKLPAGEPTG